MNKWKVSIIQAQKYFHSNDYHDVEIHAEFETVGEAKSFASMALEGCENSRIGIYYEETNRPEDEDEEEVTE